MSEYFPSLADCARHEIFPGVVVHTAWLEKLMTSLADFQPHAVVEAHSHPHEQMGIVVSGRAEFIVGGVSKILGPGDLYRIPSNVVHRVVALDGPVRCLDVFSPVRDDYK